MPSPAKLLPIYARGRKAGALARSDCPRFERSQHGTELQKCCIFSAACPPPCTHTFIGKEPLPPARPENTTSQQSRLPQHQALFFTRQEYGKAGALQAWPGSRPVHLAPPRSNAAAEMATVQCCPAGAAATQSTPRPLCRPTPKQPDSLSNQAHSVTNPLGKRVQAWPGGLSAVWR